MTKTYRENSRVIHSQYGSFILRRKGGELTNPHIYSPFKILIDPMYIKNIQK